MKHLVVVPDGPFLCSGDRAGVWTLDPKQATCPACLRARVAALEVYTARCRRNEKPTGVKIVCSCHERVLLASAEAVTLLNGVGHALTSCYAFPVETPAPEAPRASRPIYRHFKGGRYEFIGVAHVEATLQPVVVYRSLDDGRLWTRPVTEFFGLLPPPGGDPDAEPIRRFDVEGGHPLCKPKA